MEDYVTLKRLDDTMIVCFDRQGALNAFDQQMITELTDTAKLLAEEDIFVVYKQMESAYFDVKNRELGEGIWHGDYTYLLASRGTI